MNFKKILKNIFKYTLPLFFLFVLGDIALAQTDFGLQYGEQLALGQANPQEILVNIIRVALGFLGIITVLIILYAGFLYMTAAGREDQIDKAKNTLRAAIIGLIIIMSAFGIATFVIDRLTEVTGVAPTQNDTQSRSTFVNSDGSSFFIKSTNPVKENKNNVRNTSVIVRFNVPIDASVNEENIKANFKIEQIEQEESVLESVNDLSGENSESITISSNREEITYKASDTSTCGPVGNTPNCLPENSKFKVTINGSNGTALGSNPPTIIIDSNGELLGSSRAVTCLNQVCTFEFETGDQVDENAPTANISRAQVCTNQDITLTGRATDDIGVSSMKFKYRAVTDPEGEFIDISDCDFSGFGDRAENVSSTCNFNTNDLTSGNEYEFRVFVTDVASHEAFSSFTTTISPTHCCNNRQDSDDETGIDCGGSCLACEGSACNVYGSLESLCNLSETTNENCNDSLCSTNYCNCEIDGCICRAKPEITWVSPDGGFCTPTNSSNLTNINILCSNDNDCNNGGECNLTKFDAQGNITNIGSPNAKHGNLITILGSGFGDNPGGNGGVYFAISFFNDAYTFSDTKARLANNENINDKCADSWTDTRIIVEVPTGAASGPIKVVNSSGIADTTTDAGIPYLVINTIERPGLCKIDPIEGESGKQVTLHGINLTDATAYFGDYREGGYMQGGDSQYFTVNTYSEGKTGIANVPTIAEGSTSVFVLKGDPGSEVASNYLPFKKLRDPYAGPQIYSFDPTHGPAGEYVTIIGRDLGTPSRAEIDTENYKVYFDVDGNISEGAAPASFTFPEVCSDSIWGNNEVIVKVPEGLMNNIRYKIVMNILNNTIDSSNAVVSEFTYNPNDPITPNLCKIQPTYAPNNASISLWGENFGAENSDGKVRFQYNKDASNNDITFWDNENNGSNPAMRIKTKIIDGAITGPVRVMQGQLASNPKYLTVGDCNSAEDPTTACGSNNVCCPQGSYKVGECVQGQNGVYDNCYPDISNCVYEWDFSTKYGECSTNDQCENGLVCNNYTNQCEQPCTENEQCVRYSDECLAAFSSRQFENVEAYFRTVSSGDDLQTFLSSVNSLWSNGDDANHLCITGYWQCDTVTSQCVPPTCAGYSLTSRQCAVSVEGEGCPNSPGVCRTVSDYEAGSCGVNHCNTTYSDICNNNECSYDETNNLCYLTEPGNSTNERVCNIKQDSSITGFNFEGTAVCNPVSWLYTIAPETALNKGVWQIYNGSVSCPDFTHMDTSNGWCNIGTSGNYQMCDLCPSGFNCKGDSEESQNGVCTISSPICPLDSTCIGNTCIKEPTCECCCRVDAPPGQDCCIFTGEDGSTSGTTCTASLCGEEYVSYGMCTGCTVVAGGQAKQDLSDNNCICSGVTNKVCDMDAYNGLGVCVDSSDTVNKNSCSPGQDCGDSGDLCKSFKCEEETSDNTEQCISEELLCTIDGECVITNNASCDDNQYNSCSEGLECLTNNTSNAGDCRCCCKENDERNGLICDTEVNCTTGEPDADGDAERGLYCGCTLDSQCGESEGCSDISCCSARPTVTSVTPTENQGNEPSTDKVCRNAMISATFSTRMDTSSFTGKVIMGVNHGDDQCPVDLFYGRESGINWCIVPGSVQSYTNSDGNTVLKYLPTSVLESNKQYFVRIIGDHGLGNNIDEGVVSYVGVSGNLGGNSTANKTWTFTTGDKICELDSVSLDPANWIFQKPQEQKQFTATAISGTGEFAQEITPYDSVYEWEWNWHSDNNRVAEVLEYQSGAGDTPDNQTNPNPRAIKSQNVDDKFTYIHAVASTTDISSALRDSGVSDKVVSEKAKVMIFQCVNIWPPLDDPETWDGWQDARSNCTTDLEFEGCDLNYNFRTYYCRDAGAEGTYDDLPALQNDGELNSSNPIVRGGSASQCYGGGYNQEACADNSNCIGELSSECHNNQCKFEKKPDTVIMENSTTRSIQWLGIDEINEVKEDVFDDLKEACSKLGNIFLWKSNSNNSEVTKILTQNGDGCTENEESIGIEESATYIVKIYTQEYAISGKNLSVPKNARERVCANDGGCYYGYCNLDSDCQVSGICMPGMNKEVYFLRDDLDLSNANASITVNSVGEGEAFVVSWNDVNPSLTYEYTVYYRPEGGNYQVFGGDIITTNDDDPDKKTATVSGLTNNQNYYVLVTATLGNDEDPLGEEEQVLVQDTQAPTLGDVTAESLPEGLKLSWPDSGSADVEKYEIYWGEAADAYSQSRVIEDDDSPVYEIIVPLEPEKTYYYKLEATDEAGNVGIQENEYMLLRIGAFLDSAVSGLSYKYSSAMTPKKTLVEGIYEYEENKIIKFYVGNTYIGKSAAKPIITPFDLAQSTDINNNKVINIARFLQTLDNDQNPDNGIHISDEGVDNINQIDPSITKIDFNKSAQDFASDDDVASIIAAVNGDRSLVSVNAAKVYLQKVYSEVVNTADFELLTNCEDLDGDDFDDCEIGEVGDDDKEKDCVDSDLDKILSNGGRVVNSDQEIDANANAINPNAIDICDKIDNDCNAETLDGSGVVGDSIPDNDSGYVGEHGVCRLTSHKKVCMDGDWTNNYGKNYQNNIEIDCADNLDNDCNSYTDCADFNCFENSDACKPSNVQVKIDHESKKFTISWDTVPSATDGYAVSYKLEGEDSYKTQSSSVSFSEEGTNKHKVSIVNNNRFKTHYYAVRAKRDKKYSQYSEEISAKLDKVCEDYDNDGFDNCEIGSSSLDDGKVKDCNNQKNQMFPGNPEICDGIDNNCDSEGLVDEGLDARPATDTNLTHGVCSSLEEVCQEGEWVPDYDPLVGYYEDSKELSCSDNLNNDCDNYTDCADSDCYGDLACDTGEPRIYPYKLNDQGEEVELTPTDTDDYSYETGDSYYIKVTKVNEAFGEGYDAIAHGCHLEIMDIASQEIKGINQDIINNECNFGPFYKDLSFTFKHRIFDQNIEDVLDYPFSISVHYIPKLTFFKGGDKTNSKLYDILIVSDLPDEKFDMYLNDAFDNGKFSFFNTKPFTEEGVRDKFNIWYHRIDAIDYKDNKNCNRELSSAWSIDSEETQEVNEEDKFNKVFDNYDWVDLKVYLSNNSYTWPHAQKFYINEQNQTVAGGFKVGASCSRMVGSTDQETSAKVSRITAHELGHAMFLLNDEYEYGTTTPRHKYNEKNCISKYSDDLETRWSNIEGYTSNNKVAGCGPSEFRLRYSERAIPKENCSDINICNAASSASWASNIVCDLPEEKKPACKNIETGNDQDGNQLTRCTCITDTTYETVGFYRPQENSVMRFVGQFTNSLNWPDAFGPVNQHYIKEVINTIGTKEGHYDTPYNFTN